MSVVGRTLWLLGAKEELEGGPSFLLSSSLAVARFPEESIGFL
mgnify:CR=1 FL=1